MSGGPNDRLSNLLRYIEENDTNYEERYGYVLAALHVANLLSYPAGFRIDPDAPEWPVAYIELPQVGQVSWHCPQHATQWDGHTTREKYARCHIYSDRVADVILGLHRKAG